MTIIFTERTWRDALGDVVIQARMRPLITRSDYEKHFFPAVELGLEGWHRAHSQGPITGHESAAGIRYAPPEVNQKFQRLGIERFIREVFEEKAADTEVWLTTVTRAHSGTLRLKEIQYRLDALRRGVSRTLFEASIEVENKKDSPRITPNVLPRAPRSEWLYFLKPTPGRIVRRPP